MAAGVERSARGLKIIALSLAEHRMLAGLAASGLSRAEIAAQLGMTAGVLNHRLYLHGITTNGRPGRKAGRRAAKPKVTSLGASSDGRARRDA
jgi:hypothetical protein